MIERKSKLYSIVALVCLSGLVMSCERKMDKQAKLTIQLPYTSANQMSAKADISAQSIVGGVDWAVADPTTFNEISCFAIAVEAPDLKGITCTKYDNTVIMNPGLIKGAFKAGETIQVEVDPGPDRTIYAIGFAATSLDACKNFETNGGPDKTNLSAPHLLGSVRASLVSGNNTVAITASLSAAGKFQHCTDPNFGTNPGDSSSPNLSISDASVTEGGTLVFNFNLSTAAVTLTSINFNVLDGTALSGSDYSTSTGSYALTIAVGASSASFSIPTIQDVVSEPTESMSISISSAANANVVDNSGTGTIIDDDSPDLTVSDFSVSEGGNLIFQFSLSNMATSASTINFNVMDGTAIGAGNDYSISPGTYSLTIPIGSAVTSLTVSTIQDVNVEPDETMMVSVTSATNANVIDGLGIGTILNDDAPVTPTLNVFDSSSVEGSDIILIASLSATSASDVTFVWSTIDQSATAGLDYTAVASQAATIPPGQFIASLTINTNDDATLETVETFDVTLSSLVNATGGDVVGQGTINDNEVAPNLVVSDASVTEGGTLVFEFSLSSVATVNADIYFDVIDGTAIGSGSDYSVSPGSYSVSIPNGSQVATFMIATVQDATPEANETMTVSITSTVNANVTDGMGIGTILDDDPAYPTISVSDYVTTEGGALIFTASLSATYGSNVTFDWSTFDQTAANASDYSILISHPGSIVAGQLSTSVTITTTDDANVEGTETFLVSLSGLVNATAGDLEGIGTINDNDVAPSVLSLLDMNVVEGQSAALIFSISPASASLVVVSFMTYDGTATSGGADYVPVSDTVTIGASTPAFYYDLTTNEDAMVEGDEVFFVSVTSYSGVSITNPGIDDYATITINDNDIQNINIYDATASEGQTLEFLVSLDTVAASDVGFEYVTSVGSADDTDYGGVSIAISVSILTGYDHYVISIPTVDDGSVESTEYFYVNLQNLSGATAGDIVGNGNILDNDAGAALSVLDAIVNEGDTAQLVFSLSSVSGSNVDVTFTTYDSSATAGSDYAGGTYSVTILSGQTFAIFDLGTTEDGVSESSEIFMVSIDSYTNATIASPGVDDTAIVTIIDDDVIPGLWMGTPISVNEGQSAQVTIHLDNVSASNVSVNLTTGDSSATTGSGDYASYSGLISLAPGVTITTIPIAVNFDSMDEYDEEFTVSLSGVSGATIIGSGFAAISIMDMDPEPAIHISDATHLEGNTLDFMVSLSQISGRDVSFTVSLADASATSVSLSDYTSLVTTGSIPAGSLMYSFSVTTTDDTIFEYEEYFDTHLLNVLNVDLSLSSLSAKGVIRDNDGWGVHSPITAVNGETNDWFGNAVAVHGNTFVVGAQKESSSQTTITQGSTASSDNTATSSGAAYIYSFNGGSLMQEAYLKASNAGASDFFGYDLDVHGALVAVGAYTEASNQTSISINGTGSSDNSVAGSGAAYLFRNVGGTWLEEAYLKASNAEMNDYFGYKIAVSGDLVAVSAKGESSNQTTISNDNTASLDNSASASGAVYIFTRLNGTWMQTAYLKASNAEASDNFGMSLDLFGSSLIVGAANEDSASQTVINSGVGSADNSASASGAAYIYSNNGGTWVEEAYLKGSNTELGDGFGTSVAMFGNFVAVGALAESSSQNYVTNGPSAPGDNSLSGSGAVYVFEKQGGSWQQSAFLKPVNPSANDYFGQAVSATHNVIVVGAPGEDSMASGVEYGPYAPMDDSVTDSGAVYVFQKMGGSWSQVNYIKPDVSVTTDKFGSDVAIDGDLLTVGAFQNDLVGSNAGAAYTYNYRGPIQVAVSPAPGQVNPAPTFPISFNVRFSRAIDPSTFVVGDIVQSGTGASVVWSITNLGDNMNFTVQATSGLAGTYQPTVPVGMVNDIDGMQNDASITIGPQNITKP